MGALLSAASLRQVTLRAGAELDARRVNQYNLILRAACPGEDEVEERLFVQVTAEQALRCDTPFATAGRSQGVQGSGGGRCQPALGSHGRAVPQVETWCRCWRTWHPGRPCMRCCHSHLVG